MSRGTMTVQLHPVPGEQIFAKVGGLKASGDAYYVEVHDGVPRTMSPIILFFHDRAACYQFFVDGLAQFDAEEVEP